MNLLRVRHGDIHKNIPFEIVPEMMKASDTDFDYWFKINKTMIVIEASHFSQFICTSCEKTCKGQVVAMTFGSMEPCNGHLLAGVRVHIASSLYNTEDFRKVNYVSFKTNYKCVKC